MASAEPEWHAPAEEESDDSMMVCLVSLSPLLSIDQQSVEILGNPKPEHSSEARCVGVGVGAWTRMSSTVQRQVVSHCSSAPVDTARAP